MKETIDALEHLQLRINEAIELLDIPNMQSELSQLEQEMNNPDFWSDQKNAKKISTQASHLQQSVDEWQSLQKEVDDLLELAREDKENVEVNLRKEIDSQVLQIQERYEKMELQLFMKSQYAKNSAIISIHAGAGGDDAQDWAEILLRMYIRWAEKHEYKHSVIDITKGSVAGIKSVTLQIEGMYVYGQMESERGVHRLVRISPFDADSGRHTSFALVEVLPELEAAKHFELNPKEIRIDTFTSSGKGGQSVNTTHSAVRVVHEPTGITVHCQNERSQLQNKEMALKILHAKLQQQLIEQRVEKVQELKGEHKSAAWGNQIRSYVLHPYKQVKDLRTGYEETNPDAVLDGGIDEFIEKYLRFLYSEKKETEQKK
ncbi:MAG: peptide chain release factor 2 [Patescibacteria group bacterium]